MKFAAEKRCHTNNREIVSSFVNKILRYSLNNSNRRRSLVTDSWTTETVIARLTQQNSSASSNLYSMAQRLSNQRLRRTFTFSHLTHFLIQASLYLRLLNRMSRPLLQGAWRESRKFSVQRLCRAKACENLLTTTPANWQQNARKGLSRTKGTTWVEVLVVLCPKLP